MSLQRDDRNVCVACIEDEDLRFFIQTNASSGVCSYCGRQASDTNIAAPVEELADEIASGLAFEWEDAANNVPYESREGGYQMPVYHTHELLEEICFECENDGLLADLLYFLPDQLWAKRHLFSLDDYEVLWFGWEEFCRQIKHQTRYLFFPEPSEDQFDESLPPARVLRRLGELVSEFGLVQEMPVGQDFTRVRIHKSPIASDSFAELMPPPEEQARFPSRMSPAGISVLYAAGNIDTAIAETFDPKRGPATANAVILRATRALRVLNLVDLPPVPGVFASPEAKDNQLELRFLWDFAEDVSKPIVKDGREHVEYCPTQVVTEFFRYRYRSASGDRLDGVRYSSARDPGGDNYIFFFGHDDFVPKYGPVQVPFVCLIHPEPHRSLSPSP